MWWWNGDFICPSITISKGEKFNGECVGEVNYGVVYGRFRRLTWFLICIDKLITKVGNYGLLRAWIGLEFAD